MTSEFLKNVTTILILYNDKNSHQKKLLTIPNITGINRKAKIKLAMNRINICLIDFFQGIIQLVTPKVNHRMNRHCKSFRSDWKYREGGRSKKTEGHQFPKNSRDFENITHVNFPMYLHCT